LRYGRNAAAEVFCSSGTKRDQVLRWNVESYQKTQIFGKACHSWFQSPSTVCVNLMFTIDYMELDGSRKRQNLVDFVRKCAYNFVFPISHR
jgi:hypothetical protein